jgi:hypothetical protein
VGIVGSHVLFTLTMAETGLPERSLLESKQNEKRSGLATIVTA